MSSATVPVDVGDAVNARILAVSEDKIQGFHEDPIGEIARRSGAALDVVIERIVAMLRAGTIRRVRQTMLATNLAEGALVAWAVPEGKINSAFEYMWRDDPFSGHIVLRSTDAAISGARYKLWTTLKVPQGYSLAKHCDVLCQKTGAEAYRLMPAKALFTLGVGHVRRRGLEPGSKSEELAEVTNTKIVKLTDDEWRVMEALKRELSPEEIGVDLWKGRAEEAGVSLEKFYEVARSLNARGVVGRFSTFLEHVKTLKTGEQVTRYNALFHWAVPPGRELEAGRQVGRFHVMTHAYWREGGPEFGNVNVMGVAHGMEKEWVLAHKKAIDEHLASVGIPVSYTNVFWGGRSEIKPSEISPLAYRQWCERIGIDAGKMRE
jgi:hypothetical protein